MDVRKKGHNLERQVCKDLAFKWEAKTSRLTSRLMDNCKIDITGVPILIQCKAGYNKSRPKYEVLFKKLKEDLKRNFKKEDHIIHKLPYVVIHKLNGTKGKTEPELFQVIMTYDFFLELIKDYNSNDII